MSDDGGESEKSRETTNSKPEKSYSREEVEANAARLDTPEEDPRSSSKKEDSKDTGEKNAE